MKATPEELEEFKQELNNLIGETNPAMIPFMFVDMMTAFDKMENPKEFIDTIKEKYTYKDLHELVDKTKNKYCFDFYKEVYNLGMKRGVAFMFPNVSSMAENSKKLADDLEVLDKKNKQMVDKACELYEESLYQSKRTGIHSIPQMVVRFRQAMEEEL